MKHASDPMHPRQPTTRPPWSKCEPGHAGAANGVRVDFGSTYLISSVDLRFPDNGGAWQGYNNAYELRASSDGSAWQLLGSGTLTDFTGNVAALIDDCAFAGATRPVARWLEDRAAGVRTGRRWTKSTPWVRPLRQGPNPAPPRSGAPPVRCACGCAGARPAARADGPCQRQPQRQLWRLWPSELVLGIQVVLAP